MINKAIQFASICHTNQNRKSTQIPYILHPLEAGMIASTLTSKEGKLDEDIVVAAILHDVCEDAKVSVESLEEIFNERVAGLVAMQSEEKTKTWDERKQHTIEQLVGNKDKDFEIVILADKLSNLRSIKRDYQEIGEEVWDKFNVKEKSKHRWYYKSILENITQIQETPEYREYQQLIKEIWVN